VAIRIAPRERRLFYVWQVRLVKATAGKPQIGPRVSRSLTPATLEAGSVGVDCQAGEQMGTPRAAEAGSGLGVNLWSPTMGSDDAGLIVP